MKKFFTGYYLSLKHLGFLPLLFIILFYPLKLLSLTGGPVTPEVATISTVNLESGSYVDKSKGDFQYTIPVLNVPGRGGLHFVVDLRYKAGIKLNQEASWVGLGWNLNPGAIFRVSPHIPDDYFNGTVKTSSNGGGSSYTVSAMGLNYSWGRSNGAKTNGISFSTAFKFVLSFGFAYSYWSQVYDKTWGGYGFLHFDNPASKGGWDGACKMDCFKREYNRRRRPGTIPTASAPPMDHYTVTGPGPSGNILPTRPSYTLEWNNNNDISAEAKFYFTDHLGGALSNSNPDDTSAVRIEHGFKDDSPYYKTLNYFIVTDVDGTQYVYGQPAYIKRTGYVGRRNHDSDDIESRLSLETPFPYAWYLTAILSPDYVNKNNNTYADQDNLSGIASELPYPDSGDYGNWLRFDYQIQSEDYHFADPYNGWSETPVIRGNSKYTRSWGQKQIIYLSKINSPTHEAEFNRSSSMSGWESNANASVPGEPRICEFVNNGGLPDIECTGGAPVNNTLSKLDNIKLYATSPTRTYKGGVGFNYDYSLRPGTPNAADPNSLNLGGNTLTLRNLYLKGSDNNSYMTYGFGYIESDPQGNAYEYNQRKWDKWGYYKRNGSWGNHNETNECTEEEGCDAAAWSLNHITFPTGGSLHIDYGIDSYLGSDGILHWGGGLITRRLTFDDGLGNQYVSRFFYENQNHHVEPYPLLSQTSGKLGIINPPPFGENDYEWPPSANPYTNPEVHYAKVWEFPATGGYIEHDYITGAIDDHSIWEVEGGYTAYTLNQSVSACYDGITDGHCFLYDRSYAWGKPEKKTYYGPTECVKDPRTGEVTCTTEVTKEEQFFYNDYHNKKETVFVDHGQDLQNFWHTMHYRLWGHLDLSQKIETIDGVSKTIDYVYTPFNNKIISETVTDADSNVLVKTKSYCQPGNNCGDADVYDGMLGEVITARNIINLPFVETLRENNVSNPQHVSYKYNNYILKDDNESDPSRMRIYHKENLKWIDTDGDRNVDWSMTPGGPDSYVGSHKTDFDNYGNVLTEVGPGGIVTNYQYLAERANSVVQSIARNGRATYYLYEDPASNLPTKITRPDGTFTNYTYDLMGRLNQAISSSGEINGYNYHYSHSAISPTNLNYVETTRHIDGQTRISKTFSDGLGKIAMQAVNNGSYWTINQTFFDINSRPEIEYFPFNSTIVNYTKSDSFRYSKKEYHDDTHQRINKVYHSCLGDTCTNAINEIIFSNENNTTYKSVDIDASGVSSTTYEKVLGTQKIFSRAGKESITVKDLTQSTETMTDPAGKATVIFKDTVGRKIATKRVDQDTFNAVSYPWLGQVTEEFVYDNNDNLILFRDSKLYYSEIEQNEPKHIKYVYDGFGRQIKRAVAIDASGIEIADLTHNYYYDGYGSANCNDFYGNPITAPLRTDMGQFLTAAVDKLTCISSPGGVREIMFYDNDARLGEKHLIFDNGMQETVFRYYYNSAGELTKETIDPLHTIYAHYDYDYRGNRTKVKISKGTSDPFELLSLSYNADSTVQSISRTINGVTTTYGYDELNRMNLITTSGENFVSSHGFNRFYKRNAMGRILKIFNNVDDSDPLKLIGDFSFADSYDNFGRLKKGIVTSVIDPGLSRTRVYTYDDAGNRLTAAECDALSNPGCIGGTFLRYDDYSYIQGTNRLSSITYNLEPMDNFYYDENGNISSIINSSSEIQYEYDHFGNLSEVVFNDGQKDTYVYNSLGERIKKVDKTGASTYYSFEGGAVIFDRNVRRVRVGNFELEAQILANACSSVGDNEYSLIPEEITKEEQVSAIDAVTLIDDLIFNSSEIDKPLADINQDQIVDLNDAEVMIDNLMSLVPYGYYYITRITDTTYVNLLGMKLASFKDGNISDPRYYLNDNIGSSNIVLDSSGKEIGREEYYPFGKTFRTSGAVPKFQFTGKEKDYSTGLYYFNSRYYNPEMGRFMSRDTVDDGPNPYSYSSNNPLILVDPTGHGVEDALIFFGDYGEYDEDGNWVRDDEGHASQNAANKIAQAWKELHPTGDAKVVPVKNPEDFDQTVNEYSSENEVFGLVAQVGHWGEVDGFNVRGSINDMSDLRPEGLADSLNQSPQNEWTHIGWRNGQSQIINVYSYRIDSANGSPVASRDTVFEYHFPSYEWADVNSVLHTSGTACFVGCSSNVRANDFAQNNNKRAIGFVGDVDLNQYGAPAIVNWLKNNTTTNTMRVFEP